MSDFINQRKHQFHPLQKRLQKPLQVFQDSLTKTESMDESAILKTALRILLIR